MPRLITLSLLAACASLPTNISPAECRSHGVSVLDGDEISGAVIETHWGDYTKLEQVCGKPLIKQMVYEGCTIAAEGGFPSPSHEYIIWYATRDIVPHEYCHALYERPYHIWRG